MNNQGVLTGCVKSLAVSKPVCRNLECFSLILLKWHEGFCKICQEVSIIILEEMLSRLFQYLECMNSLKGYAKTSLRLYIRLLHADLGCSTGGFEWWGHGRLVGSY